MRRRNFIQKSVTTAASIAALPAFSFPHFSKRENKFFLGTPVLPEYLLENGIAKTLEAMQELVGINTVMTFSHDHVFNQYEKNFQPKKDPQGHPYTNLWVKPNPEIYPDPNWIHQDPKAKFFGRDILQELWAEAAPRGMDVYARILEPYVITGAIPGFESFAEVDVYGEKGKNICFNHPEYIRFWEATLEDLVKSHPFLKGFKFGQERGGPLLAALGKNSPATCFCEHCLRIASSRNISVDRARSGFQEIQKFGNEINGGASPADGHFATFLRILFQHADVLLWEQLWMDSRENQRKRIYGQLKKISPSLQVGWHIDHGMTWDIFMRASWDYQRMGSYSDWLSVAVYFDSMGRRSLGHFQRNYENILFGDASQELAYSMYLSMLGYDPGKQPTLAQHLKEDTSFSSDYIFQECQRAVQNVNGQAKVYARPGFDMPGYDSQVTPDQVYEAATKALEAGVDGLWCGREWDELKPENAQAFGNAVKDWKKKNQQ